MKLILKRLCTGNNGTFGVLLINNIPFALTLEREWLNNQCGLSCIPAGIYTCSRVNSPRFGNTFEVCRVPGRTAILFHKGNIDNDSHGCILVGEQFDLFDNQPGVLASAHGFNELLVKTATINQFTLEIIWS